MKAGAGKGFPGKAGREAAPGRAAPRERAKPDPAGLRILIMMVWKEFQHLKGDRTGLRLMFLVPVVQLFVLSYALTTEVKNTPVAVVDYCRCPESRALAQAVLSHPLFRSRGFADSEAELRERMDRGEIKLALSFPQDFARRLEGTWEGMLPGGTEAAAGAPLRVLVDGQDGNSSQVAAGYLQAIINGWSGRILEKRLLGLGRSPEHMLPVRVEERILFNPLLQSTWYMVPGIAVLLVTMVTALLTGLSIVREKEAGTLEQLMVTPLKPWQLVLGKAIPFMVVGFLELSFILALAALWFGIPVRGSFALLFAFTFVYMFSSLGLGIFTSALARTQMQALFIIWFLLLFFILLSGFFIPIENMPGWVQKVTLFNPVRYYMAALRDILLKGAGLPELWRQGAAMLALGLGLFGFAVLKSSRSPG